MAAAGGFNLNALLADQDDDFEMLKRIGEYQSKLAELRTRSHQTNQCQLKA
jgi:hypothetical protein